MNLPSKTILIFYNTKDHFTHYLFCINDPNLWKIVVAKNDSAFNLLWNCNHAFETFVNKKYFPLITLCTQLFTCWLYLHLVKILIIILTYCLLDMISGRILGEVIKILTFCNVLVCLTSYLGEIIDLCVSNIEIVITKCSFTIK